MVTYRRANKEDIKNLVRIRSIFLTEFDGKDHLENKANVDLEVEKYLVKFIETDEFIGFVAEEDNKIICKFNKFLAKQNKKLLIKNTGGKTIVQMPTEKLIKKVV